MIDLITYQSVFWRAEHVSLCTYSTYSVEHRLWTTVLYGFAGLGSRTAELKNIKIRKINSINTVGLHLCDIFEFFFVNVFPLFLFLFNQIF